MIGRLSCAGTTRFWLVHMKNFAKSACIREGICVNFTRVGLAGVSHETRKNGQLVSNLHCNSPSTIQRITLGIYDKYRFHVNVQIFVITKPNSLKVNVHSFKTHQLVITLHWLAEVKDRWSKISWGVADKPPNHRTEDAKPSINA